MDRREAIITLRANVIYACESAGFNVATINLVTEALDLAIEALKGDLHCPKCGTIVRDGRQYHDLVYRGEAEKHQLSGETSTNEGVAESATTTEVDYCNNCPYLPWGKDCISRQDAIEALEHIHIPTQAQREYAWEIFDKIPPVTPTERTGEWKIWNEPGNKCVYCTKCKHEYDQIDLYIGGSEYPNYCPNCGAKMGGDTE